MTKKRIHPITIVNFKNKMILKRQDISVIVPVYNEKGNIKHFHKSLQKAIFSLKQKGYTSEIIYIDDNSNDGTYEWLRRKAKSQNINILQKTGKKGKAYSLIEGFSAAQGKIL